MSVINPFETYTYLGPKYFCDREEELEELIDSFDHRRNMVIASPRKLGKTNLIHHLHHALSARKNTICIYIDIMYTSSDEEFINTFITGALNAISSKEDVIQKFSSVFKNLQPEVGFDPITNLPKFKINIKTPEEYHHSFDSIMRLLFERKENIQIAIDEFQQIENYDQKTKMDALIRSYFPKAKNLHFIFSGSEAHLLNTLFKTHARPMFSSTGWMNLGLIGYDEYFRFITKHFNESDIKVTDQEVYDILKWTEGHTFYTHYLCNLIFLYGNKGYSNLIDLCKSKCLKEFESSYYMYKRTLTTVQYNVLKAIAKENGVKELTSKNFLSKYNLSASSAKRSVDSLIEKQFIREHYQEDKVTYVINDIFFKKWLQTYQ